MDASQDVSSDLLNTISQFIRNTISQLQYDKNSTRTGLISYAETAQVHLNLREGNNDVTIMDALQRMRQMEGEADLKALMETVKNTFESQSIERNGKYFVLFISSVVKPDDVREIRQVLNKAGVNLLVVDVGQNNKGQLDVGEDDDVTYDVIFIRQDDINSIFQLIIDGLKNSKKEKGNIQNSLTIYTNDHHFLHRV